jgi:hypothetical protein
MEKEFNRQEAMRKKGEIEYRLNKEQENKE